MASVPDRCSCREGPGRGSAVTPDQGTRDLRAQGRAAFAQVPQLLTQVVKAGVLEQIAAGARFDGGHHMGLVSEDADDEDLALRVQPDRAFNDFGARAIGQAQVGQHDVGALRLQPLAGLGHAGTAVNLNARHGLQSRRQPLTGGHVVFNDEDELGARRRHEPKV